MFLRACVRVFFLKACCKKDFANAILAVNNGGVHQPLKNKSQHEHSSIDISLVPMAKKYVVRIPPLLNVVK